MDIEKLAIELAAGHPDTGAYNADAEIAAAQLNAVNRTNKVKSMTGTEILNAADYDEGEALSDADKDRYWRIINMGSINPWGHEATIMIDIFGVGSLTITSLKALRKTDCSRANEDGLAIGWVRPGDITQARSN